MKRCLPLLVLLALLLSWGAQAQTRKGLMKQVEASMLLTGRIDVSADGTVAGYSIDKAALVPPDVLAHVARQVPHWSVAPAVSDGSPVASSSPFSLRLLARRIDGDRYSIQIVDTHIDEERAEHERLTVSAQVPPVYPTDVFSANGSGVVYLLLKIDRDGRVVDTHVERVDLTVLATRQIAQRFRKRLADSARLAARDWTFHVPASGPQGDQVVRTPIAFVIGEEGREYGTWMVYLPGERTPAPWPFEDDGGNGAAVPGKPMLAGSGMRLVSGLEPEGG